METFNEFCEECGFPHKCGKDIADNLGYHNGSRDINEYVITIR